MTCHDDIITRWADRVLGRTNRPNYSRNSGNVYAVDTSDRTDTLFSYGSHFPMAQPLRDADGSLRVVLVNGDDFSVTTARHQRLTRNVIARAGMPSIIVPFSALDGASIARSTVRPLEVTDDRTIHTDHATTTRPDGTYWKHRDVWAYRPMTDDEVEQKCQERDVYPRQNYETALARFKSGELDWKGRPYPEPAPFVPMTPDKLMAHETQVWAPHHKTWQLVQRANPRRSHYGAGPDDGLEQWNYGADITAAWSADDKPAKDWPSFLAWAIGAALMHGLTGQPTRAWRWRTGRHQLGESLFTADVTWREMRTCRKHDYRDGFCTRCHTGQHNNPDMNPGRYQIRRTRKAVKFLSGFDNQEPRPLYFLCEMPRDSVATTVADAYEELKPSTVKLGERLELPVTRQGDIFAVMVPDVDKRGLRKLGATFERMRDREARWTDGHMAETWQEPTLISRGNRDACLLLGTNHMATEVARMPDGTTLARGVLRHVPSGRPADHRRQRMADGKSWHVIVKNTVPIR